MNGHDGHRPGLLGRLAAWWHHLEEKERLRRMPDRLLADVGLERDGRGRIAGLNGGAGLDGGTGRPSHWPTGRNAPLPGTPATPAAGGVPSGG
jgi:uncharacterized protein YjiS (DUF1127 family)